MWSLLGYLAAVANLWPWICWFVFGMLYVAVIAMHGKKLNSFGKNGEIVLAFIGLFCGQELLIILIDTMQEDYVSRVTEILV